MRWSNRKNGISVLLACQNEERIVDLSIRSFLDFGDELIVVDNGSQDRTREIVWELQSQYPKKISFYDAPGLVHLHENRQFALSGEIPPSNGIQTGMSSGSTPAAG